MRKFLLLMLAMFMIFLVIAGCDLLGFNNGDIEGTVVNQITGEEIENVTITAGGRNTHTNEEGAFFLKGVPAGEQVFKAIKQGYEEFEANIVVEKNETLIKNIELTPRTEETEFIEARQMMDDVRNSIYTMTSLGQDMAETDYYEMLALSLFEDFVLNYYHFFMTSDFFVHSILNSGILFELLDSPGEYSIFFNEATEQYEYIEENLYDPGADHSEWHFEVIDVYRYEIKIDNEWLEDYFTIVALGEGEIVEPTLSLEMSLIAPPPYLEPEKTMFSDFDYETADYRGEVTFVFAENYPVEEFLTLEELIYEMNILLDYDFYIYDNSMPEPTTIQGLFTLDISQEDNGFTIIDLNFNGSLLGPLVKVEGSLELYVKIDPNFNESGQFKIASSYLALWTPIIAFEGGIAADIIIGYYDPEAEVLIEPSPPPIIQAIPVDLSLSNKLGLIAPPAIESAGKRINATPKEVIFDPSEWDLSFIGELDLTLQNKDTFDFFAIISATNPLLYKLSGNGALLYKDIGNYQGAFSIEILDWHEQDSPSVIEVLFNLEMDDQQLEGSILITQSYDEGIYHNTVILAVQNQMGYSLIAEFDTQKEPVFSGWLRNPSGANLAELFICEDNLLMMRWLDTDEEEPVFLFPDSLL